VTTDEVTVGVVWADTLTAKIPDAQVVKAFPIMIAKEPSADVAPQQR
jgi:hypothetical protein